MTTLQRVGPPDLGWRSAIKVENSLIEKPFAQKLGLGHGNEVRQVQKRTLRKGCGFRGEVKLSVHPVAGGFGACPLARPLS